MNIPICPQDCVYIQRCGGVYNCGYIFEENHSRGCEPGPGCLWYRKKGDEAPNLLKLPKERPAKGERRPDPRLKWNAEAGRQMFLEGYSDREIAEELGAPLRSVQNQRRKHWGSTRPPGATWDVGKGRALWRRGLSDREIAAAVGTSQLNVKRFRRKYWEASGSG